MCVCVCVCLGVRAAHTHTHVQGNQGRNSVAHPEQKNLFEDEAGVKWESMALQVDRAGTKRGEEREAGKCWSTGYVLKV